MAKKQKTPKRIKIVKLRADPRDACTVATARPGLFLCNGTIVFMNEYGDPPFCAESGEYFWGGTNTDEARDELIAVPLVQVVEESR